MRCVYSETARDSLGNVVGGATVRVYLAGTTTPATFYQYSSSTAATTGVTTGSDGVFTLYVDRFDYDSDQKFKIIISRGTTSITYDNVSMDRVVTGTYTISANKTVSTHITIPKGVIYSVASGKTLTFSGSLSAGTYQIFSGSGTVTGLKEAYPEWFGAVGDGVTDDTGAIQAALDSARKIIFGPNIYRVSLSSDVGNYNYALRINYSNTTIEGVYGQSEIKLMANQDCTVIRTAFASKDGGSNLENIKIRNLIIDGDWDNQTWAGPDGTGVYDQNGLAIYCVTGFVIEDVTVRNCAQDGLPVASSADGRIENVIVENTGKGNNSIFLGHNIVVEGGKRYNANSSPDGGVSKAIYTLSSDGYAGIHVGYAPSAGTDAEQQNEVKVIGVNVSQTYGRGIAVTDNATSVDLIGNTINLTDAGTSRHGYSLASDAVTDDVRISISGGSIRRSSGTTGRLISATNVKELTVSNVYGYNKTTGGSFAFIGCGNVNVNNNRVEHGGATTFYTFDVRGLASFSAIGNVMDGTISFNTTETTYARCSDNTVESFIENRAIMLTGYNFMHNNGDSSEVATLTWNPGDIADGDAATQEISVVGAKVGDIVVATFPLLVSSSFVDGMQISAVVSEAGKVKVTITNHTGSNKNLDSGTLKVRII